MQMKEIKLNKSLVGILATVLLTTTVLSCSKSKDDGASSKKPVAPVVQALHGKTMGTSYSVKYYQPAKNTPAKTSQLEAKAEPVATTSVVTVSAKELGKMVEDKLALVNKQMSTYDKKSELSQVNQSAIDEDVKISKALLDLLQFSQQLSQLTQGAFDITVGPLVNLWGFGPDFKEEKIPERSEIDEILKNRVGSQFFKVTQSSSTVSKTKNLYLDLSAVAKGYGVDELADLLESHGIYNYLVEVGGELRASGEKPSGDSWKIAIESPVDEGRAIKKIINVNNVAVATSGDYRNFFKVDGKRYSHAINPVTGFPVENKVASATVLHNSAAFADAFATSLMVMGPEKAMAFAKDRQLAVFLLIRNGDTFEEKMTDEFKTFLAK